MKIDTKLSKELQLEKYLHTDQTVTIYETRNKRSLIKRTNEGCLQLSRHAILIFKSMPIFFPPNGPHQT